MGLLQIILLSVIQGLAELLPVSSSAHVILVEKWMGLDPSSPEMTFFLVMLHLGTMFAVIAYFWPRWRDLLIRDLAGRGSFLKKIVTATLCTVVVGFVLKLLIEKVFMGQDSQAEVEDLFGNLWIIGSALAAAGILILISSSKRWSWQGEKKLDLKSSAWIGTIQGICLPFRGFSRSGATISMGLILGIEKNLAEVFSFILAVVLTPPVIGRELLRLRRAHAESGIQVSFSNLLLPGLMGMVFSFIAGWIAIRWLSKWLENGKWYYFGIYCLFFSGFIFFLKFTGTLS